MCDLLARVRRLERLLGYEFENYLWNETSDEYIDSLPKPLDDILHAIQEFMKTCTTKSNDIHRIHVANTEVEVQLMFDRAQNLKQISSATTHYRITIEPNIIHILDVRTNKTIWHKDQNIENKFHFNSFKRSHRDVVSDPNDHGLHASKRPTPGPPSTLYSYDPKRKPHTQLDDQRRPR